MQKCLIAHTNVKKTKDAQLKCEWDAGKVANLNEWAAVPAFPQKKRCMRLFRNVAAGNLHGQNNHEVSLEPHP